MVVAGGSVVVLGARAGAGVGVTGSGAGVGVTGSGAGVGVTGSGAGGQYVLKRASQCASHLKWRV